MLYKQAELGSNPELALLVGKNKLFNFYLYDKDNNLWC